MSNKNDFFYQNQKVTIVIDIHQLLEVENIILSL